MISSLGAARPPLLSSLGASRPSAAAGGWWLSGGISAANCIAAYQPKGAASYAASKVNLSTPGVNDAVNGDAFPTWDAINGWTGDGTQYLDVPAVFPTSGWSVFVRFTNATVNTAAFGCRDANDRFYIIPNVSNVFVQYYNGRSIVKSPILSSGNLGMAGQQGYRNGVLDGPVIPGWLVPPIDVSLWLLGSNGGPFGNFIGSVQAFAIYNTVITQPQITTLVAAMAAL